MSKPKKNMTDNLLSDPVIGELTAIQDPDQAAAPAKRSKAQKTASVYMSNDQHAALERIAQELDTNKHAVMQLAIKHFIEDYESGNYKPQALYKKVYF